MCPKLKTMELTVGSPCGAPRIRGSFSFVYFVDDGEHAKLQEMLDWFYRLGISANITTLYINNDNQKQSNDKFTVLIDSIIKHNSMYFPQLKALHIVCKCSYVDVYLKNNVHELIYNTHIDAIWCGNSDKYQKVRFSDLHQVEIAVQTNLKHECMKLVRN